MPTVFERRRLATTAEIAALVASFDAAGLDLDKAEVSELATLAELGRSHTVLLADAPAPGGDSFYANAQVDPLGNGRAIQRCDPDPRSERATEPAAQTRLDSAARERPKCTKPPQRVEGKARETPTGPSRFVWAERESNPHSQRRLIYSQRSSPPARSAQAWCVVTQV